MARFKVLLVGAGTVGEAIAKIARGKPWLESMVLADFNVGRAREVQAMLGDGADTTFPAEFVDAGDIASVVQLARRHGVDLVMNAADPRFVPNLFDAAFEAGVGYMDMATSLSVPDARDPFHTPGVLLGDYQFARHEQWKAAGRLAVLGLGMDPGLSDVFARYAAQYLFDEVDEVHVRDGGDLYIEGYAFAPVFSIWTTIEECLNPPLIWEREGGFHTTEPFSAPESFVFPEGIGPVECVNVEHEEVVLVPRGVDCRKVTFKYALGREFIDVLRTLHKLGLDSTKPITVKGAQVAPRDVVAALTPDPAHVGDRMKGRAVVGTWVIGRKDGMPREVYLYQKTVAEETWRDMRVQAVGWQTGFNPVVGMELLASGTWSGAGVLGAEAFEPQPYLDVLDRWGIHWALEEREPGASRPT
ncbi:MAG TPA: saccharopine dehydrogenase C-terminal domain-containing protein [Candidatus Baltobacteraceae bacterium]|nr:saccharopine dehydrogenase C-terminal domain-containing protein [Candidatus Baltobacteraceae bacterium]